MKGKLNIKVDKRFYIYYNNKNNCEGKESSQPFTFTKGAVFKIEDNNKNYLKGKPLYASYFDIEEDGSLDIIIATDKGIECYFNNYESDTFFIKSEYF